MKNNKKTGFTFAEILITLAIIGIIAATVLPSLVQNASRAYTGSVLGRTVSAIQNGTIKTLDTARNNPNADNASIETLDILRVRDVNAGADNGILQSDLIPEYLFSETRGLMSTSLSAENSSYLNSLFEQYNYDVAGGYPVYKIAKVPAFVIPQTNTSITGNPETDEVIMRIFIDTNGIDGPNRFGEDVFIFGLLNNGHMVPAGSAAYNNNAHSLNENIALYTTNCMGNTIPDDARSCTARVMADGWKINYR